MTDDLYRLVYYSRNLINAMEMSFADEVRAILAASQSNNARANVTGALLFNAGCFGQVLEGPRRAIETTFERIQRDPRHGEVSLLALDPIDKRAFPNWSMGFVSGTAARDDQHFTISDESGFDPSRMSGDRLFETLHRLALESEQSAAA